jgi:hypothetical protein
MNKELEEASEKWLNKDGFNVYNHYDTRPSFIAGAKWMQDKLVKSHISIDEQVNILIDVLNEMMVNFEPEEDRMDFILDICNGYKKQLEDEKSKSSKRP